MGDNVQSELDSIIGQVESLHPLMPLPLTVTEYLEWLEKHITNPNKLLSVSELNGPNWEVWMLDQNVPLFWAASWYARKKSQVVKKVSVSDHKNPEVDYIVFAAEFVATRNTSTSGNGSEAVYVYGFENDSGYLKIGKAGNASTVSGAYKRVAQQISTSNRTLPIIHHVFFTSDSTALEVLFHSHFKSLGKWAFDGAGTEWFRVSLDEILNAYPELAASIVQ